LIDPIPGPVQNPGELTIRRQSAILAEISKSSPSHSFLLRATFLLAGRDLALVLRNKKQLRWGDPESDNRSFISVSRNRRNKSRIVLAAAACIALCGGYYLLQEVSDQVNRGRLAAIGLPADVYRAPNLESLSVDFEILDLGWVKPPLKELTTRIDESGRPNKFPPFITDLTLTGNADNVAQRYTVDCRSLPRALRTLTLQGVTLRNAGALKSLGNLRNVTLREDVYYDGPDKMPPSLSQVQGSDETRNAGSYCPEPEELKGLPVTTTALRVDCIAGDFSKTPIPTWKNLKTLEVLEGADEFDLSALPSSLEKLTLGEAPPHLNDSPPQEPLQLLCIQVLR
jgi:hypothetical protein